MASLIRKPINIATSKPAQKTYLNTVLFLSTSFILFIFAIIAYAVFYYNWVPAVGVERRIWLQYGPGQHPHAIVPLPNKLNTRQEYSVALELHMPRSPTNLETGNFMISIKFLGPSYKPSWSGLDLPIVPYKNEDVLFSSRRPAILTYESKMIGLVERMINLPWYVLGWKREDEIIRLEMSESVRFQRGARNLPVAVEVVVEREDIQVYGAKIILQAKLAGMRWWMWNWRVGSAVVGVGAFWGMEMVGVMISVAVLRLCLGGRGEKSGWKGKEVEWEKDGGGATGVKEEAGTDDEPDLSDTPRTFPTVGRQMPLVYPPVGIKKEEDEEGKVLEETVILPLGGDADDEDEDEEGDEGWNVGGGRRSDSGLGTSFSEGGPSARGKMSRRRSRGGPSSGV